MNNRVWSFIVTTLLLLGSCTDNNIEQPVDSCASVGTVSFETDVQPLITANCTLSSCHDGTLGEDRNWTIFAKIEAKALSIRDRITRPASAAGHMPPNETLTSLEIQTIVCWIDQGALNN